MESSTVKAVSKILRSHATSAGIADEDVAAAACRAVSYYWLKCLDEHRHPVAGSASVGLGHDLLPDPSVIVNEICADLLGTAGAKPKGNLLDPVRMSTLYVEFIHALRGRATDVHERIQISDTAILTIGHGRFTLERIAPDSP